MKTHTRSRALLSALVALGLAALACARTGAVATETAAPAAAATATDQPRPTPTEAAAVEVTSLYSYEGQAGLFNIAGLIYNATSAPVSLVDLSLTVVDAQGVTVLVDKHGTFGDKSDDTPLDSESFSPLLATLASGETAPFWTTIVSSASTTAKAAWQVDVTVADWQAGTVDRADLEVIHDQMLQDAEGALVIVGELANRSDQPVLVNGLSAARLDETGLARATGGAAAFSHYLAAAGDEAGNDTTPFAIYLLGPAADATETAYYWDADLTEALDTAADVSIDYVRGFWSDLGQLHMLAEVTNHGAAPVSVQLIIGQYAADDTVIDSAEAGSPIAIEPGQTVPINIDRYTNLIAYSNFPELRNAIDHNSIRFDLARTAVVADGAVELDTADIAPSADGEYGILFDGDIVNITEQVVVSATLMMSVYDADHVLVTTNMVNVLPATEPLAAGAHMPFEILVTLPFQSDKNADYSFESVVRGYPQP